MFENKLSYVLEIKIKKTCSKQQKKPISDQYLNSFHKSGQKCFTCNAASYDECYANGSFQECDDHHGSCQLEVRKFKGKMVGLAMRCAQPDSCLKQMWQNFNSKNWKYNQCKPNKKNRKYSTCRLCSQQEDGFQSIDWQNGGRAVFEGNFMASSPQE